MAFMQKRRFAFPHPTASEAQIEPVIQPLSSHGCYDAAALTGQREMAFFKYAQGQTSAGIAAADGTVSSTVLHTNMETPGFIASPKVFLATGTRVVFSGLNSALSAEAETATTTSANQQARYLEDLMEILYGTYYRFYVGTKDYLVCPTWMVPGNTGVGGLASVALSGSDNGPAQQLLASYNSTGKYFSFGDNRVLIPSQQNFHTSLNASQAVPPTVANEVGVYSVLDGVFGREVQ